jgi:hypothetical protein
MWTNNDDTMRRVQIDTHAGVVLSELYTYPCAFVGYVTGRNEDMRENMGLFIFTDRYCFVVEASVAADWAMDYQERIMEWLATLEFVEGEGAVETSGAPGAMSDVDFLSLCINGTGEEVERAIRAGANVNAADGDDWTALHFAALHNGDPSVVEILLENGANVNARDNDGDTPLMNAVLSRRAKTIMLLLEHGADAGIPDNEGRTVFEFLPDSTPAGVGEDEWEAVLQRLKNPSASQANLRSVTLSLKRRRSPCQCQ